MTQRQQPNQQMFFTYVVRPGDAPEGRGPMHKPFWDACINYNLRIGFGLQLAAFIGLCICSLVGRNGAVYLSGVLAGNTELVKNVPLPLCLFFTCIWIIGTLVLNSFPQLAEDDAAIRHSRGYRAGVKAFQQATLLDVVSGLMTAVIFYSLFSFFEDEWMMEKTGSGSMSMFILVARTVHAFSLMLYAMGVFCLEGYHSEGTVECWAWLIATLYKGAAIFELLSLALSNPTAHNVVDVMFTLTFGAALVLSCLWSAAFEPLLSKYDVKMTQSALRTEFYKTQNAMAYYGPPIVQG
eukprot:Lankesteria_metandrocarpae@DN2327_c0_g1_i1.p1